MMMLMMMMMMMMMMTTMTIISIRNGEQKKNAQNPQNHCLVEHSLSDATSSVKGELRHAMLELQICCLVGVIRFSSNNKTALAVAI